MMMMMIMMMMMMMDDTIIMITMIELKASSTVIHTIAHTPLQISAPCSHPHLCNKSSQMHPIPQKREVISGILERYSFHLLEINSVIFTVAYAIASACHNDNFFAFHTRGQDNHAARDVWLDHTHTHKHTHTDCSLHGHKPHHRWQLHPTHTPSS